MVFIFIIVTSWRTRPPVAAGGGLECKLGWSTAPVKRNIKD